MKITGLVIFNCYFHGEQYENYHNTASFVIHTKILFNIKWLFGEDHFLEKEETGLKYFQA